MGRVWRLCFWCMSDKSSPLFLICVWKIDFWPRQYDFRSDTIIFDFQSKRNSCKYSKITHLESNHNTSLSIFVVTFCLVTQVTQNALRTRWTLQIPHCAPCWAIPIPPCVLGWANRDCFPYTISTISINRQVIIQNRSLSLARYLGLSADNHLDGQNGCQ